MNPFTTRSNRPEAFCENGVIKNFATFAGKHLCWSLFLIILSYQRETPTQVFSCENCKIFKTSFFFIEDLWWQLLLLLIFPSYMNPSIDFHCKYFDWFQHKGTSVANGLSSYSVIKTKQKLLCRVYAVNNVKLIVKILEQNVKLVQSYQ